MCALPTFEHERWKAIFKSYWNDLNLSGDYSPVYENLMQRYSEHQRAHHGLQHLQECLELLQNKTTNENRPIMTIAYFSHDAIYDPSAPDNEDKSIELAREILSEEKASPDNTTNICRLIEVTKPNSSCRTQEEKVFKDIDCWVLGSEFSRYQKYLKNIECEFASAFGVIKYKIGRAKFLAGLLLSRNIPRPL